MSACPPPPNILGARIVASQVVGAKGSMQRTSAAAAAVTCPVSLRAAAVLHRIYVEQEHVV